MAKVWPVYEGKEPTVGGPWAVLPLEEAISLFELRQEDFVSDPKTNPRFGAVDRDLRHLGYKHIVVEVDKAEARTANWKPGFYKSRVKPEAAFERLIRQPLVAELGEANVLRVQWEPTTDSQGREALKITAVIAPGAVQRIKDASVLDALVRLQERLHEMSEQRAPIIDFATEAELNEDAGA